MNAQLPDKDRADTAPAGGVHYLGQPGAVVLGPGAHLLDVEYHLVTTSPSHGPELLSGQGRILFAGRDPVVQGAGLEACQKGEGRRGRKVADPRAFVGEDPIFP